VTVSAGLLMFAGSHIRVLDRGGAGAAACAALGSTAPSGCATGAGYQGAGPEPERSRGGGFLSPVIAGPVARRWKFVSGTVAACPSESEASSGPLFYVDS